MNVFIKEYRSQRISIIGAVEKPGAFDVSGRKTVLDILAMAGGLKEDAGSMLFLIRPPGRKRTLGYGEGIDQIRVLPRLHITKRRS